VSAMTGREIVLMVLRNIGEDTDETTYGEYEEEILCAVNEAYQEICAHRYLPRREAEVELGPEGEDRIEENLLPRDVMKIMEIRDEMGRGVGFLHKEGSVVLKRKCRHVFVNYVYRPEDITAQTEPILPKEYHAALSDYGAFRLMIPGGKQRQARADLFYANYARVMGRITPMEDRRKFVGMYR